MRFLRTCGLPDDAIGTVFGVSRQRVSQLIGPRPLPEPRAVPEPLPTEVDTLPEFLLAWRTRAMLTQRQAANLCGVTLGTWNAWETGRKGCGLARLLRAYLTAFEHERNTR